MPCDRVTSFHVVFSDGNCAAINVITQAGSPAFQIAPNTSIATPYFCNEFNVNMPIWHCIVLRPPLVQNMFVVKNKLLVMGSGGIPVYRARQDAIPRFPINLNATLSISGFVRNVQWRERHHRRDHADHPVPLVDVTPLFSQRTNSLARLLEAIPRRPLPASSRRTGRQPGV